MTVKPLPPQLRSLVHHVELNKSGWWDRALAQLILYVLYQNGQFLATEEIRAHVADILSTSIDSERLTTALQDLKSTARIIESKAGAFKITEEQRATLIRELEDAEQVTNQARAKFIERVTRACPTIDAQQCWDDFHQQCLLPLVLDMGARTYEFVSEGILPKETTFEDTVFFKNHDHKDREALRTVVFEYLTPHDEVVREFMLRTLNSAFFLEASGLHVDTLDKLVSPGTSLRPLTLFLDTNLLFSLMELHDNPANESVISLFHVLDETTEAIPCSLYVLPITVEEFRRALVANRESLKRIALSPNVIAATRDSGKFSGMKLRFFDATQEARTEISPEEYFDPYISNPATVMQTKGVELLNEGMSSYESRQDVIDGINHMWDSERAYRKTDWRYRAIKHDMMLWHFVNDRRPAYVESLSEAGSWIVTIDYRLLRYDREAHNRDTGKPNCIHPSVLIQMLRFWLPRSDAFESAVLESLRLPFIFRSFDSESEAVALRILEVLARFEIGDISPEAIGQLLVDDALNMAIREATDRDVETELVADKLSSMESSLRDDLEVRATETQEYRSLAEKMREQLKASREDSNKANRRVAELDEQLAEKTSLLTVEQMKREEFEAGLDRLESDRIDRRRVTFLLKWILLTSLVALLAFFLAREVALAIGFGATRSLVVSAIGAAICVLIAIRIADWRGGEVVEIEGWRLYQRLRHFRRKIYGLLGIMGLGIIGTAIWDTLKGVF